MWIPLDPARVFFPRDLAVYPYCIAVIHLSHVCRYMLSPVSPSSESEGGDGLGNPSAQLLSTGILHPQALV